MDTADIKPDNKAANAAAPATKDLKGATVALAPPTDAVVTSVHRPAPGSISVVEVPPGAQLKLDFASTEAKFAVLDVDLVLLFPDGAKVIFPGYAFNLVGPESSEAVFSDKVVSPQQLLAFVDELRLLNDINSPLLGSNSKSDQQNQDQGKEQSEAKETPAEDAPPRPAAAGRPYCKARRCCRLRPSRRNLRPIASSRS